MRTLFIRRLGMFVFLICALLARPAGAEVVVQVMSVQDEAAAQKEASRLFDLGVPAFTRAEQLPERGLWSRVYVGPFETESDAAVAAETLKKQGVIKEFVVKNETAAEASASAEAALPAADAQTPAAAPEAGAAMIGADGQPAELGDGVPVFGYDDGTAMSEPAAPPLPVAETPTYGEPVSPEQAQELGLTIERVPAYGQNVEGQVPTGGLSTYGQGEQQKAAAPGALPDGFKVGDSMPGLVPPAGSVPQAGAGLPAGLAPGDNMPGLVPVAPGPVEAAPPVSSGNSSARPSPAPSAGDDDGSAPVLLMAQAKTGGGSFADYGGGSRLSSFDVLVDLSSSMRRMADCQGRIKEEAVGALLRKMNHRIPNHPYTAALRVFGYKIAITRRDFTTLYYGPSNYNRDEFEDSIARLIAADSVSPFATAINESDGELQNMPSPKAILMFADFEESIGSGQPVQSAGNIRRRYGSELAVYTFYITRQNSAVKLAKDIAQAGGGKAYNICLMLDDEVAFENMMMDIFGPSDAVPCADQDGDGVCDADDICPNTPKGAPVDERGCWIAAYSQFFDFDKAVVKPAFLPRLQHAAEIINRNPQLPRVLIAGHTDNVGSPEYNMGLGRRRAQAVFDHLVKYGVEPSRLTVESFGETRPVATNNTEEGRARNRRVEFHIGEMPPRQK